jgi:hypothetical protein
MQRNAANFLGLLLGIGVSIALPRAAQAGDTACQGGLDTQNIVCPALTGSSLLKLADGTNRMLASGTFQLHEMPAAILRVADTDRRYQMVANGSAPAQTIISQIHNAPGWQHSHTYASRIGPYTRVVNGPGWDEASGIYKPGQSLDAYQLTSDGSCTSARSGGPTGTGSNIADGTCTWKYLSPVDYISITGWTFDNKPWKGGTAYLYGDYVVTASPLRAYELINPAGCTSTVAPTGTASGSGTAFTTSDGCQWKYWADVLYSSGKSYIPTQRYLTPSKLEATYQAKANHEAQLWNDREYVAGQNGEAVPIRLQAHFDYTQDGFPYDSEGGGPICVSACRRIILMAAPGESFIDSRTPLDPLTGYDPAKGVAIRNPASSVLSDGFHIRDNSVDLIGLQIKSDHGNGVGGGQTHGGNDVTVRHSIVEGGSAPDTTVIHLDAGTLVENSLVVAHGNLGIRQDYPGTVLHSTLVNPDRVPNSVAIQVGIDWVFTGETVSNTAIFGFAHAAGSTSNPDATDYTATRWFGTHNITDAPVGDRGTLSLGREGTSTARILPGTVYGSSAAAAFRAFPGDYRLAASSPLIGAGNAHGPFSPSCQAGKNCPPQFTFDTPDIIGTTRPQAGRYDIGAWQSCASASADCRRSGP